MHFSKNFLITLDKLAREVESAASPGQDMLFLSVKAWCNQLRVSEEFSSEVINDFRRQGLNAIFNVFLGECGNSFKPRLQWNPDVSKFIQDLETQFHGQKRFKTKFYLLSALVVVSVAYVLKKINQSEKENVISSNLLLEASQSLPSHTNENSRKLLVLVINCKYKELILNLKDNSTFTPKQAEELYQATQELWAGTVQEYDKLPIQDGFISREDELEKRISEYDVYFIKVLLSEIDNGFKKDASQLSRLDAFMRLPEIAEEIEISERLSSKAYANIGVYSR